MPAMLKIMTMELTYSLCLFLSHINVRYPESIYNSRTVEITPQIISYYYLIFNRFNSKMLTDPSE